MRELTIHEVEAVSGGMAPVAGFLLACLINWLAINIEF